MPRPASSNRNLSRSLPQNTASASLPLRCTGGTCPPVHRKVSWSWCIHACCLGEGGKRHASYPKKNIAAGQLACPFGAGHRDERSLGRSRRIIDGEERATGPGTLTAPTTSPPGPRITDQTRNRVAMLREQVGRKP